MKKTTISVLISMLIILMSIPNVTFAAGPADVPPINEGIYEISTAEQLKWFADSVNAGNTDISAILMNDIDLSSVCGEDKGNWTPIGFYDDTDEYDAIDRTYNGSFNGDMKNIRGLYIDNNNITGGDDQGLFGAIGKDGMVMFTNVYGSVNGYHFVGGICGRNRGGAVLACHNFAEINGTMVVGGICGGSYGGVVTECTNKGKIQAESCSGGICGILSRAPETENERSNVTCCENNGSVTAKKYSGGIVGKTMFCNISNCLNTGTIEGNFGGGIGGQIQIADLKNCLSLGTVADNVRYYGGICGSAGAVYLFNSYYNSDLFSGEMNGYFGNGEILNCNGVSEDELKSGKIAYFLNDGISSVATSRWSQNLSGENIDDYPLLCSNHGLVYQVIKFVGCIDSTGIGDYTYVFSNKDAKIYGPHIGFENGFCTACGSPQDDYIVPNNGVYEIHNANQLKWFAAFVNKGNTDINAKLCDDIDISSVCSESLGSWIPIGGDVGGNLIRYNGKFDGNGKKISGLYINSPDKSNLGLFGCLGKDGIIKNLTVAGSISGDEFVSGICGKNEGQIENCSNYATVHSTSFYTAGISGQCSGTISRCRNYAKITQEGGSMFCGGICGIAGYGFVGESANYGDVCGTDAVGGITGYGFIDENIINCANYGNISGANTVGGISGNNLYCTVSMCISVGEVKGDSETGGICGSSDETEISDCYFNSDNFQGSAIGNEIDTVSADNVAGKPKSEFTSGKVCYLLGSSENFDSCDLIWYQTLGKDDYPVLDGTHNTVILRNNRYYNPTEITIDSVPEQIYTGNEIKPAIQIHSSADGFTDNDYTIIYANNTAEGTATITVMPSENGNFRFDEKSTSFVIKKQLVSLTDNQVESPDTGDKSNLHLWIFLLIMSVSFICLRIKKEKCRLK